MSPAHGLKAYILIAFLLHHPLIAQAAPVAPDAGSILQQVQPAEPLLPSPDNTGLHIEPEAVGKLPPSAPFEVKVFKISGNTLFDTLTLHALVADEEGKNLTLPQLDKVIAKITDYYRSHGYPLSRAIIPAQTIKDGVVEIKVIEAYYGKIGLDNSSRVDDTLLQKTLAPLQSGQAISQAELDHTLLLFTDIPGMITSATLKPGEAVGTSDLQVEAASGRAVSGNVVLDSYGNRYIGRVRAGGTVIFNNPMHHGDYFSINGTSSGSGLNYGGIAYETLLNGFGTRLGGSYSSLHYILGDTLSSLNGHGIAQVASVWAKHPFMRSPLFNFYGQLQYDRKQLRDHLDLVLSRDDRHLKNWTASFSGDARDSFLAGAVNAWSVSWTAGHVVFDDAAAKSYDATTKQARGSFSKLKASATRVQNLNPGNALYFALTAQAANTNLAISEKLIMGGANTVRAYESGTIAGDTGYLLNVEFRHSLQQAWHGQWQAVAFLDRAHVTVNRNTWVAGPNSATLNGAGVGLNWTSRNQWGAKFYAAKRIGSVPLLVGNAASANAWVEINKGF